MITPPPCPFPPGKAKDQEVHHFRIRFNIDNQSICHRIPKPGPRPSGPGYQTRWGSAGDLHEYHEPLETSLLHLVQKTEKDQELSASDSDLKNQRRFRTQANLTTNLFFGDIPEVHWDTPGPLLMSSINAHAIISNTQIRIVKRTSVHSFV